MRIVRDSLYIDPADRGGAVAIGNFDGVHLGHQAVIDVARDAAAAADAPLGILTFEPHPRQYFVTDTAPFRLMNAGARAHRLAALDVRILYELPFNRALAELSAQEFARLVLHERLGLAHVVVGEGFHFGRGRDGSAADLVAFGKALGFGTTVVPLLTAGPHAVSSTAIRQALTEGRPRDAAAMLGHAHVIEGVVVRGDQRGRDLGFPTANLSIAGLHPPRHGVYAVRAEVFDGPHQGHYLGAASIGTRPMFGGNQPNCETFLFDFKGDLYGATMSVALIDWLRPEEKFDSLDALIIQMDADCTRARVLLATP